MLRLPSLLIAVWKQASRWWQLHAIEVFEYEAKVRCRFAGFCYCDNPIISIRIRREWPAVPGRCQSRCRADLRQSAFALRSGGRAGTLPGSQRRICGAGWGWRVRHCDRRRQIRGRANPPLPLRRLERRGADRGYRSAAGSDQLLHWPGLDEVAAGGAELRQTARQRRVSRRGRGLLRRPKPPGI